MEKEEKKKLKKENKEQKKELKRLKKEEKKLKKENNTKIRQEESKNVKYVFKFSIINCFAILVIISILIINILPSVTKKFNNQNKMSFVNQVKNIYDEASKKWEKDSAIKMNKKIYTFVNSKALVCNEEEYKSIPISLRTNINYIISFTKEGKVDKYYITDGVYEYKYEGQGLEIDEEKIKNEVSESKKIEFNCKLLGLETDEKKENE